MSAYNEFQNALSGKLNESLIKKDATKGNIDAIKEGAKAYQTTLSGLPKDVTTRIDKVHTKVSDAVSAAQGTINTLTQELETDHKSLNSLREVKDGKQVGSKEAIEAAEKVIKEKTEKLTKTTERKTTLDKRLKKVEGTSHNFNQGTSTLKAKNTDSATRVAQNPTTSAHYSAVAKHFDQVADFEAIKNAQVTVDKIATAGTNEAAKGSVGSWVSKLAPSKVAETFKASSTGVKFGRVAGTGAGLVLVYDGLTRAKSGDQDRGTLTRIGEVAAGLGVAGASLAVGGRA